MKNITASGPLLRWRTVDLLTAAFLGVAFGVAYWGWAMVYQAPANAVSAGFPPLGALLYWPWLVAGIVGMLVIRRPGAAIFTELLAAVVEAILGNQWGGAATLLAGFLQGLGVELGFAIFGYALFRWAPLVIGGFLGGAFEAVYEWYAYWTTWGWGYKIAYLLIFGAAVAILGSLVAVAVTRLLARAGALNPFPPGQEVRERHAV